MARDDDHHFTAWDMFQRAYHAPHLWEDYAWEFGDALWGFNKAIRNSKLMRPKKLISLYLVAIYNHPLYQRDVFWKFGVTHHVRVGKRFSYEDPRVRIGLVALARSCTERVLTMEAFTLMQARCNGLCARITDMPPVLSSGNTELLVRDPRGARELMEMAFGRGGLSTPCRITDWCGDYYTPDYPPTLDYSRLLHWDDEALKQRPEGYIEPPNDHDWAYYPEGEGAVFSDEPLGTPLECGWGRYNEEYTYSRAWGAADECVDRYRSMGVLK